MFIDRRFLVGGDDQLNRYRAVTEVHDIGNSHLIFHNGVLVTLYSRTVELYMMKIKTNMPHPEIKYIAQPVHIACPTCWQQVSYITPNFDKLTLASEKKPQITN